MKQTKKYIITMAALLLSVTTWAQGKFTYIYQLNGSSSTASAAGTISGEISENGTATLTLTPAQGNYINADYIIVAKTLSGGNAQTRIGTAENVSITASNANADPSGVTTYTFAVEDSKYDYEVTANFQSRTSISSATVTLATTSYTYDGQEHKPTVSSVKLGGTTLATNDYTVSYADDCTNVGTVTVTIAGARTYTGTATATYSINEAAMTVNASGYTGTYDGQAHGITVEAPQDAVIKYGTTEGNYNLETSPEYTDAGNYTVYYQVTRTNYQTVTGSKTVIISKADINPTIALEGWTYGAPANTPEVNGNTGNGTEAITYKAEGAEEFSSEVPSEVGTYIVKVTIAETTNYNGGEATSTFTITNRTIDPAEDIEFSEGQSYASFYSANEDLALPEEGIAVFMITGIDGNTLTTQAVTYIPKGVPVLVMKSSGATQAIDPSEVSNNMLHYATSDVTADGTTYILYNGEYVRATGTIPAGKCYLKLNKPSGARALAIGNGTTGIDRLDNTEWATDNWFDLNGRRIEKPTKKGLYIKNGKKVVVK